jgi:heme/copper-type cytochrome/quinol oxidase subunit 4
MATKELTSGQITIIVVTDLVFAALIVALLVYLYKQLKKTDQMTLFSGVVIAALMIGGMVMYAIYWIYYNHFIKP